MLLSAGFQILFSINIVIGKYSRVLPISCVRKSIFDSHRSNGRLEAREDAHNIINITNDHNRDLLRDIKFLEMQIQSFTDLASTILCKIRRCANDCLDGRLSSRDAIKFMHIDIDSLRPDIQAMNNQYIAISERIEDTEEIERTQATSCLQLLQTRFDFIIEVYSAFCLKKNDVQALSDAIQNASISEETYKETMQNILALCNLIDK
jgi:hypothetical protein